MRGHCYSNSEPAAEVVTVLNWLLCKKAEPAHQDRGVSFSGGVTWVTQQWHQVAANSKTPYCPSGRCCVTRHTVIPILLSQCKHAVQNHTQEWRYAGVDVLSVKKQERQCKERSQLRWHCTISAQKGYYLPVCNPPVSKHLVPLGEYFFPIFRLSPNYYVLRF